MTTIEAGFGREAHEMPGEDEVQCAHCGSVYPFGHEHTAPECTRAYITRHEPSKQAESADLREDFFCRWCRTRVRHVLKEHDAGECAAAQIAQHEARQAAILEPYARRQRILARSLAVVLMSMAAGKRPPPDALVAIVQEWGAELR